MSHLKSSNYPTQYESWLTLKDGNKIFIRPIKQTDEHLVTDLFKRLSARSIYLRFLTRLGDLPEGMLYQFTHVNYSSEFALVGISKEDGRDAIIVIARYANSPKDNITELAVAVRDDWQHLGLGKTLLKKIVDIGKENGIYRYSGMMDTENKVIIKILLELGYKVKYSLRGGFYEVEILV